MKSGDSRKKSPNDWIAEMMANGDVDEVPQGWATISQISMNQKIAIKTAINKMSHLLMKGKVQRKQFRIRVEGTGVRTVWHYAPKA